MTIPICPFCSKPLDLEPFIDGYTLACNGADGHFYGVHAATEFEARMILARPQKKLVEALSAMIALPIEQRRREKLEENLELLHQELSEKS